MKKILLLTFFILLNQSFYSQKTLYFDKEWKETSKENAEFYRKIKKKKNNIYLVEDFFITGEKQFVGKSSTLSEPLTLEGTAVWYNKEGKITQKGNFKNNLPNGNISNYYSNGVLKSSGNYVDGKSNGLYTEYFPTGEISSQANFIDDKIDGLAVSYKSPNKLNFKMNYKMGVVDGSYEFYNSNNTLFMKGNAKEDSQDGVCQEFFYEGELYKQYFIKNKKLDGEYIEYGKDKDIATIGHFKDGVAIDYDSKSLRTINGSKFSANMKLVNNIENWKIYRDKKLILESFYENGKKVGLWKMYNYDGTKLYQTIDFKNASGCEEEYIQKTGDKFTINFSLSDRFKFDSDIIETENCENVIVNKILEDENDTEHPFYHRGEIEKQVLTKLLDEPDIIEYTEPSNKPEFLSKNNCKKYKEYKDVMICEKEIDKIFHKVILSEKVDLLQNIKKKIKPNDNEIYFLFQQYESRKYDFSKEKRPERYEGFVISEPLKEAFRSKTLDYISVIGVYEHNFWNVSDFSGLSAYNAFEKEMKSSK